MLHREEKTWNNIKKYSVVHPLMRIGMIGFFSLLSIGLILATPEITEAHEQNNPVESMIRQIFGPHAQSAIRVARCESGLNPGAYNPAGLEEAIQQAFFKYSIQVHGVAPHRQADHLTMPSQILWRHTISSCVTAIGGGPGSAALNDASIAIQHHSVIFTTPDETRPIPSIWSLQPTQEVARALVLRCIKELLR